VHYAALQQNPNVNAPPCRPVYTLYCNKIRTFSLMLIQLQQDIATESERLMAISALPQELIATKSELITCFILHNNQS
jgi:hypothetical protein